MEYPKKLLEDQNELPFLAERIKIVRVEKLEPNLIKMKRDIWYTFRHWMKR